MRLFLLKILTITIACFALPACESSKKSCPDVKVTENCEIKCKRTTEENGVTKVCGKYLMLMAVGNNEILQRKTKRIETRQLPKETCYAIDEAQNLTDQKEKSFLEAVCKSP